MIEKGLPFLVGAPPFTHSDIDITEVFFRIIMAGIKYTYEIIRYPCWVVDRVFYGAANLPNTRYVGITFGSERVRLHEIHSEGRQLQKK